MPPLGLVKYQGKDVTQESKSSQLLHFVLVKVLCSALYAVDCEGQGTVCNVCVAEIIFCSTRCIYKNIPLSLFEILTVQKIEMHLLLADPMKVMGDVST